MSNNTEILERAIKKAINGGWDGFTNGIVYLVGPREYSVARDFVFNHDFAKALWGEGESDLSKSMLIDMEGVTRMSYYVGWQYHLQQMVIAEDPIKYLGENI